VLPETFSEMSETCPPVWFGKGKKITEVGGADWGVGLGFDAALVGKYRGEKWSGWLVEEDDVQAKQAGLVLCVCKKKPSE
jgi:hypothetical protein